VLFIIPASFAHAQENIGMSTGNYAGSTGVWFNPASIADSRLKYDINIFGVNSYFNNNYLLVKRDAFAKRLFFKDPYNSSFEAVKNDLLEETWPVNGNVNARVETNIFFPLSFMATTSKKSAIAFRMNNRTVNQVDSLNPELARLFFYGLSYPELNGKDIGVDSVNYRFLNWQEVSFTYSRVMVSSKNHFLKLGVTLKWLGANAGGYIQAENAVVNFRDSTTLSLSSPLIKYARTERADIGTFRRRDVLNNLEDQSFGWDAGLVYEFRANVKKFKYIDLDLQEQQRRDLNKYLFRIGLSLVDMGKFTLTKKPLTNDHSADIVNWDFSDVGAHNFSDFDTAYSKQIDYIAGASPTFTFRLPAAIIGNIDLHLMGNFYVNAAVKAPFEGFKKTTDAFVSPNRWVAITPRFEGRHFGLYVPVVHTNKRTNIGATLRLGPFYFGSTNLSEILSNETAYEADFHAGFRIPAAFGKPSRLSKYAEGVLTGKQDDMSGKSSIQKQIDSLGREIYVLQSKLKDTNRLKGVQIYINNDGVTSTVENSNRDSIVIRNRQNAQQQQARETYNRQQEANTDTLIRMLAIKNLEVEELKKTAEKNNSGKGKTKAKKAEKQNNNAAADNAGLEREISRLRRQMAVQNAAIVGGTAAVVVATSDKDDKKGSKDAKADSTIAVHADSSVQIVSGRPDTSGHVVPVKPDTSLHMAPVKSDTVYIRDTVTVDKAVQHSGYKVVPDQHFDPILFEVNSAAIKQPDKKRLEDLAATVSQHQNWKLELTGMTDPSGSVSANRKVATARYSAVKNILLENGVKDSQIIVGSKLGDTNNMKPGENPRRVEIRIMDF
jgi:outer membrane protein OmpA-like peptidoglycan-associated protein